MKTSRSIFVLALMVAGCDCGDDTAGEDAGRAREDGRAPLGDPDFAECGGRIFDASGELDEAEYDRQARLWDRDAIDCRLGPTWDELHPGAADERPTLFEPPVDASRVCGGDVAFQTYEYGLTGCDQACPGGMGFDYLSTSAQLGYVPDEPAQWGVDRLTTFGVVASLVAVRPQFGPPRERTHPDEDLFSPMWPERGFMSGQPIAISRNHLSGGYRGHQGLAVFDDGFVGGVGTITDGVSGGLAILQVGFRFPDHLVPTDVAITSHNELALVTLWDTNEHVGRLGVFAMHSNFPLFDLQTWWYVGLPSSGAFTGMKYLGAIELPIRTPTSLAVATNGIQANGPHATGGRRLGEFGLIGESGCDPAVASQFSLEVAEPGQLADIVASKGYAIVASRWEHEVVLVDLEPLLGALRNAYLEDTEFCNTHVAPAHVWTGEAEGIGGNPGSRQFDGEDRWPYPFVRETTEGPTLAPPVVAETFEVVAPIDVEAGMERDGEQAPRAFVLTGDGTVQVIRVERLMSFWPTREASTAAPSLGPVVDVCDHPTAMTLENSNDELVLACRGDRVVQTIAIDDAGGTVAGEISDAMLDDPVAVETNDRGPILTVADFHGRQVVNYMTGDVAFSCASVTLEEAGVAQRGGAMAVEGTPFLLSGANVN
jgi:hypothetical protein